MKKIILLFSIILFCSCEKKEKPLYEFKNKEQQKFANLYNKLDTIHPENDIQEKEMSDAFYQKIDEISDELIVNNWVGEISDIKVNEYGKDIEVSFIIRFSINETDKITFSSSYILANDKKDNDVFYNKIKKITNLSTVYFDGRINTDLTGKAIYSSAAEYASSYYNKKKDFKFYPLNISLSATKAFSDKLSLYNDLSDDIFKILHAKTTKSMSVKKWEAETKRLTDKANTIKLSKEENEIAESYKKYLFYRFLGYL